MYKKHGQLVERKVIYKIADNFVITKHAKKRFEKRCRDLSSIRNIILNNTLAYYNTDGSINIGIDDYRYMVVVRKKDKYVIITFKETVLEPRTSIYERRRLALQGVERKKYYKH